jgi:hypothetical protein
MYINIKRKDFKGKMSGKIEEGAVNIFPHETISDEARKNHLLYAVLLW